MLMASNQWSEFLQSLLENYEDRKKNYNLVFQVVTYLSDYMIAPSSRYLRICASLK